MFSDNTLTPKEAIRLCALGTLAATPMSYSALAAAIRHFVSRVMGPSLEVMGTSIELLKLERLIAADGNGDDAPLRVTDAGRAELKTLLVANVRAAATDLNKLVIALKFRFMHMLDDVERQAQAELLLDVCERELTRLDDLRQHHADDEGFLVEWLDHDIQVLETRLKWLQDFRDRRCADI